MKHNSEVHDWLKELSKTIRPSFRGLSRTIVKKKRTKKFLKKHTWDAADNILNLSEINMDNDKIFLGVSDVEDLITAEILKRRADAGVSTVFRNTSVLCNREKWQHWAENQFKDYLFVQSNSSDGFIVEKESNNLIKFSVNSNTTDVRAFGDESFVQEIVDVVEENFDQVTCHIEWVYGSDGQSVNVPLNRDRLPCDEMYPFLNGEPLNDYYDRYMESSANILLLIGPPGTGKTTFIRGLLAHTNSSAIVSYDGAILDKDGFFARFIESDDNVMVLEDSDAFLKSRSDGNTMMHRFLNVGDGLVTTKGKKMIFSTNLPSIRDIDSALTRPGRCFDIVTFDALNIEQANNLAKTLEVDLPAKARGKETEPYSIAEVFNQQTHKTKERKMGFV
jgi:SpoVK/Ycf46/Vps4 family AAA+-type ATPase